MKRAQTTLDIFIKKQKLTDDCELPVQKLPEEGNKNEGFAGCSANTTLDAACPTSEPSTSTAAETFSYKNDIGNYTDSRFAMDDQTRFELLQRPWKPSTGFKMPFSTHFKKGKQEKRYLKQSHLDSFPWLVYSDVKKGVFCKYCVLFIPAAMGGYRKQVPLQKLVKEPLTVFAKLLGKDGDLVVHEKKQYHKDAVEAAKDFVKSYNAPKEDVLNKISTARLRQVEENRQRLKPIVETIIFLGRQNISFRGHRDDGKLCVEAGTSPLINEGNFRELLRYRVNSGDSVLAKHLENSASNATYISKTTQNLLIACCGNEIQDTILNRVKEAEYYSVIFDESTDISHTSQLSLCLTYVLNNERHEDFLEFVNVHDQCFKDTPSSHEPTVSGKVLGQLVLQKMKDWNLDPSRCVGVGTDGCSMMVSEQVGAVAEIRKTAKYATRCLCFNHALNLSLSKTSTVRIIRNSVGIIKEVVSFFSASAKRMHVLVHTVGSQLKSMCETRWIERNESLIEFMTKIEGIVETLEQISNWDETKSSSKANILLSAVQNSEFIIALQCQLSVFHLCLPLSQLFQKKTLDLNIASGLISDLLSVLKNQRRNSDVEFSVVFSKASEILSKLEVPVQLRRMSKEQMHRSNIPCSTPEEYYRRTIYVPMLDSFITDLETRFSDETLKSCQLTCLLPQNVVMLNDSSLSSTVKDIWQYYGKILTEDKPASESQLSAEAALWREKWLKSDRIAVDRPSTITEVLKTCDEDVYVLVNRLLKILLTLPVSVASCERSFSSLRRLKDYLRSQMTQERLTALALLYVHREIEVDVTKIIERFGKSGRRKLDILL